ncbi:MAG: M16 family metallopeptidase [Halanaerobiales bacterium]
MKRKLTIGFLVSILLFSCLHARAEVDFNRELYRQLSEDVINEQPEIEIPEYRSTTLENGIRLFMLKDDELPYLKIMGYIKGGKVLEEGELAGITDFMVNMMNTGTENYGEKELNKYKERHAVDFSLGSGSHQLYFSGDALTTEQEELLSLAREVLLRPRFDASYHQRLINERERSLMQAKTRQENLASMYFYRNIYSDHPYSYGADIDRLLDTLQNYNPDNLATHYRRLFVPEDTVIMVYGDFSYQAMETAISDRFGDWTGGEEASSGSPEVEINKENFGRTILVDKPDATQAKIVMGYNLKIDDFAERVKFNLADEVFGSGNFTCRLFENLRDEKGYVYNVSSNYSDRELGGTYVVETSVRPDKARETTELIRDEIEMIVSGEEEITGEEIYNIVNKKNAFFPEDYRYKEDVFESEVYNIELEDREPGYLNRYVQTYNQATAAEINEVFKKYIAPEKFLTVIVGKKEDVLPAFEEEGIEVEVKETGKD